MSLRADLRRMIGLAFEALAVEIDRRFDIAPTVQAAPVAAPVETKPAAKWESPAFHIETLKSEKCPECGEKKQSGWYFCGQCVRDRFDVKPEAKPAPKRQRIPKGGQRT